MSRGKNFTDSFGLFYHDDLLTCSCRYPLPATASARIHNASRRRRESFRSGDKRRCSRSARGSAGICRDDDAPRFILGNCTPKWWLSDNAI